MTSQWSDRVGMLKTISPNNLVNWCAICFIVHFIVNLACQSVHIDTKNVTWCYPLICTTFKSKTCKELNTVISLLSSSCSSLPAPQNVLHSFPSCHLGVRGTGGLPSSPALDPGLCYPGAQHPWQPGRQHLPPGEAGVRILAAGGESCCRAAVWPTGSSEVCAGQQTPQRQTCPGEGCLTIESDILGIVLLLSWRESLRSN